MGKKVLLIQPHSDDVLFSASKYLFEASNCEKIAMFTVEGGDPKRVAEDKALCDLFGIKEYFNSSVEFIDESYYFYYKELKFKNFTIEQSEVCLLKCFGKDFLNDLSDDIRNKVKKYKKKGYEIVVCLGIGHPMHWFVMDCIKDMADTYYRDFPHSYKRKAKGQLENFVFDKVLSEEHFDEKQHEIKFESARQIYKTQRGLLFFEKGYIDKKIAEQYYKKFKLNYKIAIPSYQRPELIKTKTLQLLESYKIDKNKITIFVANKDEEKLYKKSLNNKYKIVVGVPTLNGQRSFITKYYPKGTYLMQFDDDLTDCLIKIDDKNLVPIKDLEKEFIIKGFKICEKLNSNFFGYYAVPNPFFMKKRIRIKLSYICGGAFGEILTHDKFLETETNHGEDYERSIRYYIKNKKVVRFDYIYFKTKGFIGNGGLQTIRTKKYIYESIRKIATMFPRYCDMYIRKTTGNAELRLRDKML